MIKSLAMKIARLGARKIFLIKLIYRLLCRCFKSFFFKVKTEFKKKKLLLYYLKHQILNTATHTCLIKKEIT